MRTCPRGLRNQVPLEIGGKRVPAGELVMLIDLKSEKDWTLIPDQAQTYVTTFDPANTRTCTAGFQLPARPTTWRARR